MATIDELADRLQQFFAAKFPSGQGDGPGTVLLVFDSLGTPLSPNEYIGSGTDAAKDILGHQSAARLADQLPASNLLSAGWYLPKAGSRLSNWYEHIVSGAIAAAVDETSIAEFEALKAAAANDLRQNKLISATGTIVGGSGGTVDASGTHDQYFATSMAPVDWYEEAAICWQHYDLQSAEQPPPPPPSTSMIDRPRFSFQLAKDLESPDLAKFVARAVTTAQISTSESAAPVIDSEATSERPAVQFFRARAFEPGLETAVLASAGRFQLTDAATVDAAPVTVTAEPFILSSNLEATTLLPHIDFSLTQNLQIDPVLVRDATTAETPTSDNFEISFDYCLVRFDRPWWAEILLLSHQWSLPGFNPGDIASGSARNLTGPVTLITIGVLIVKKLLISAHWSDSDKISLAGSTSLGPFCIAGSHYDSKSGTISRAGMQAIAWLCQVPPTLPPSPM